MLKVENVWYRLLRNFEVEVLLNRKLVLLFMMVLVRFLVWWLIGSDLKCWVYIWFSLYGLKCEGISVKLLSVKILCVFVLLKLIFMVMDFGVCDCVWSRVFLNWGLFLLVMMIWLLVLMIVCVFLIMRLMFFW